MDEDLTKATHSMMFAVGSLQDAERNATKEQRDELREMIQQAETLQKRIESFHFVTA